MDSFFSKQVAQQFMNRLNNLPASTLPHWGVMTCGQMLAHCCEVNKEALGEKEIIMVALDEKTRKKLLFEITKDDAPRAKGIEANKGSVIVGARDFGAQKSNFNAIINELATRNRV